MQNELLQVLAIAVVIAPITTGFTEIFKRYTPAEGKLLPVLSIGTGILRPAFGRWLLTIFP